MTLLQGDGARTYRRGVCQSNSSFLRRAIPVTYDRALVFTSSDPYYPISAAIIPRSFRDDLGRAREIVMTFGFNVPNHTFTTDKLGDGRAKQARTILHPAPVRRFKLVLYATNATGIEIAAPEEDRLNGPIRAPPNRNRARSRSRRVKASLNRPRSAPVRTNGYPPLSCRETRATS